MNKKAIILFSGGLDSTTCLAIAKNQGYVCYTLSFFYGQKHQFEIEQAKKLAKQFEVVEHKVLTLPLDEIGGSSLIDCAQGVPDYEEGREKVDTYVPARNTIFLSMAIAWAEVIDAKHLFIGANCVDYSGYPDCRPEYFQAFEKMASLGRQAGELTIHTPLLYLNKMDIIRQGINLGIDYSQTLSCYRADEKGRACGKCDACYYRQKGFQEAGIVDPTLYI